MGFTILVPYDGSKLAAQAFPYATELARAAGGQIVLVHVVAPFGWDVKPPIGRDLVAQLEEVAAPLRANGIAVRPAIYNGYSAEPGVVITAAAREQQADLIVMSTLGRGGLGRFLYGSTADQVLCQAETPILLVPAASPATWPTDRPIRMLLPTDDSELAASAVGPMLDLARELRAELLLLNVVEPQSLAQLYPANVVEEVRERLDKLATELRAKDAGGSQSITTRVEVGPAGPTIARVAREAGVDLIAMATHGRGGLSRLTLGSVATAVVQRATVPLLLLGQAALKTRGTSANAGPV